MWKCRVMPSTNPFRTAICKKCSRSLMAGSKRFSRCRKRCWRYLTMTTDKFDPFTVVLATHNPHKVKEIMAIFHDVPIQFLTLDKFPGAPDVVEDGKTLEENAQKKAYEI